VINIPYADKPPMTSIKSSPNPMFEALTYSSSSRRPSNSTTTSTTYHMLAIIRYEI